ncbi:hypothetical protein GCK32_007285 [Trichostrongylus colubriformis]|uniref:Uncharacterized protein n=1 Tax=Trichostrongylus colubriformis TaxID=6319 RepID=A0AAN8FAJ6_TRICO
MKELLLLVTLVALSYSQNDGGNKCNYPATGTETLQNAVPIKNFHTSGADFIRPSWCITHCKDRTSIKAAMDFQLSTSSSSSATKILRYAMPDEKPVVEAYTKDGQKAYDDGDYCVDPDVSAIADQVFQDYHTVSSIAEALNYKINKTGWAYLVYEMGPPPSIISTMNVHQDPNFCMKDFFEERNGQTQQYSLFAGLVKN